MGSPWDLEAGGAYGPSDHRTASAGMPVIQLRSVGKYFGPPVEMDGASRPREAWRSLLRIAGFAASARGESVRSTVAVRGHVLRDVSLTIARGSVVCLSGAQDAATVLLQILAGAVAPTAGVVEIHGQVSSLLSLEKFDRRRTADELIRSSPRFLSLSGDPAEAFVAEVVDFAELLGFEYVPLRTFSSGMILRLAAALALCGRPDIVLIDDVLAVGDIGFQRKCADRVLALKEAGCTLVLAFGDESLVRLLATRIVTLGDGRILDEATPGRWQPAGRASDAHGVTWRVRQSLPEDDVMALRTIAVRPVEDGGETSLLMALEFEPKVTDVRCRPSVILARGRAIVFRNLYPTFLDVRSLQPLAFSVTLPTHCLADGDYTAGVSMTVVQGSAIHSLKARAAVDLTIARARGGEAGRDTAAPMVIVPLPWEIEAASEERP